MNKRVLNSLTELERNLVAETEKSAMAELDEDALLELHTRIRRARTKYVKLYRREASAQVAASGGRGKAYARNQRNRDKAEIFERSLARVSRRVDLVAKQAAADLKAERLAAAKKSGKKSSGTKSSGPKTSAGSGQETATRTRATKTTGGIKKDASSRSQGARRQAKRDSR